MMLQQIGLSVELIQMELLKSKTMFHEQINVYAIGSKEKKIQSSEGISYSRCEFLQRDLWIKLAYPSKVFNDQNDSVSIHLFVTFLNSSYSVESSWIASREYMDSMVFGTVVSTSYFIPLFSAVSFLTRLKIDTTFEKRKGALCIINSEQGTITKHS